MKTYPILILLLSASLCWTACHLEELPDISGDGGPQAAFTVTPMSCDFSCTVTFTNDSENSVRYEWRLDSVVFSQATVPPPQLFSDLGQYTIQLVAFNELGDSSKVSKTISVVDPNEPPTPAFTISRSECFADNCALAFTNTSINAVRYEWDFGDGSPISTLTNPTHAYLTPGDYTVTLHAWNDSDVERTATQTVTVRSRQFSLPANGLGSAVRVLQLPNTDYVIVGSTFDASTSNQNIYITVIDTTGTVRPNYPHTFNESNIDLARDAILYQDKVLIVGRTRQQDATDIDIFYIELDPTDPAAAVPRFFGDADRDEQVFAVLPHADEQVFLLGHVRNPATGKFDHYVQRVSADGIVDFGSETVSTPDNVLLYAGLSIENTDVWGVGSVSSSTLIDGYTLRLNTTGDVLDEAHIGGAAAQVWNRIIHHKTADRAWLVGSNAEDGADRVWLGELSLTTGPFGASDTRNLMAGVGYAVCATPTGYAIAGTQNGQGFIARFDDDFTLLSDGTVLYDEFSTIIIRDLIPTRDGGFMAVGSEGDDLFAVKTDQFGKVE